MLTTLSKTVAIAIILSGASLFAQDSTATAAPQKIEAKSTEIQAQTKANPIPRKDSTVAVSKVSKQDSALVLKTPKQDSTAQDSTAKSISENPTPAVQKMNKQKFYQNLDSLQSQKVEIVLDPIKQETSKPEAEKPVVQTPKTDSTKAPTTAKTATPKEKKKRRTNKSLQSLNFFLPIESESWTVKSEKLDWSSLGYQFSWTRYKVEEGGLSSVFGLGVGYINGDLKDKFFKNNVHFNGLDLNIKFGLGGAPISNNFILAIHGFFGIDFKMAQGEVKLTQDEILEETDKFNPGAIYADVVIGGDAIVGYHIFETIGIIAGFDITTNAFGIGAYSREPKKASKVTQLHYVFSGINITPHIGIFFAL